MATKRPSPPEGPVIDPRPSKRPTMMNGPPDATSRTENGGAGQTGSPVWVRHESRDGQESDHENTTSTREKNSQHPNDMPNRQDRATTTSSGFGTAPPPPSIASESNNNYSTSFQPDHAAATNNNFVVAKKCVWTDQDELLFCQTLRSAMDELEMRDKDTGVWSPQTWSLCEEKLKGSETISGGAAKVAKACHGKWNVMRYDFMGVRTVRRTPGFIWNSELSLPTATDRMWDAFLARDDNKKLSKWRSKPFPRYDDLEYLVGDHTEVRSYHHADRNRLQTEEHGDDDTEVDEENVTQVERSSNEVLVSQKRPQVTPNRSQHHQSPSSSIPHAPFTSRYNPPASVPAHHPQPPVPVGQGAPAAVGPQPQAAPHQNQVKPAVPSDHDKDWLLTNKERAIRVVERDPEMTVNEKVDMIIMLTRRCDVVSSVVACSNGVLQRMLLRRELKIFVRTSPELFR